MTKYYQFRNKLILTFTLILTCLISCKNSKTKIENNHAVFKYNEHKNINSLDPAFAKDNANIWAVNQLFNGLVEMDDLMQVKPSIERIGLFRKMEPYTLLILERMYFSMSMKNLEIKKLELLMLRILNFLSID